MPPRETDGSNAAAHRSAPIRTQVCILCRMTRRQPDFDAAVTALARARSVLPRRDALAEVIHCLYGIP